MEVGLLLLLAVSCATSVTIPIEWTKYIENLISESSQKCVLIVPPSTVVAHSNTLVILPHVILWEPMAYSSSYFSGKVVCTKSSCGQPLSLFRWNTGSSAGHCPRILHEIQYIVLLVPVVYRCINGHEILSTDPQIITQFIEQEYVPFILFHRSGITRVFGRTVIQLALKGLSFSSIESFVIAQRMEHIASLKLQVHSIGSGCSDAIFSFIEKPYPSNDLLYKCFIQDFLENKHYYFREMAKLATSGHISIDHTFKVAANLGYVRPDGRWITQFEAILIVLNNRGQIVAWQLTETTSFDEVLPTLNTLSKRLEKEHSGPKIICVDNCCNVRNKLCSIFGSDCLIRLDIFHAVQRIVRSMPKKHPMFCYVKKDISTLFRNPSDKGNKRQMETPNSETLLNNVHEFIEKWRRVEINGWHIISDKVMDALEHLKVHMSKGCLSNIPPGCGTNRNENLHRSFNPFFSRCRIGIPLALALLTILFHQHNQALSGNSMVPILHARALPVPSVSEIPQFGFANCHKSLPDKSSWIFSSNITSIPEVDDLSLSGGEELDLPSDIAISDIYSVLRKALATLQIVSEADKKNSLKKNVLVKMAPFMSHVSSVFNTDLDSSRDNYDRHHTRLCNVVQSCGYKMCNVVPDGNCCFGAVAFGLLTHQNEIMAKSSSFFTDRNLPMQTGIEELARALRKQIVDEWLSNPHVYQGFLTDCTVEEEAPKFLKDGYYHGELSNTMITGLSNLLGIPIVIFSSAAHHPVLFITPRVMQVSLPIYVAFCQYGSGHYDGICTADDSTTSTHDTKDTNAKTNCFCGRNDKSDSQEHCDTRKTKYGTVARCQCLRSKRECTQQCKCRNCTNPFGSKPKNVSCRGTAKPRRGRERHCWQKEVEKSAIFAVNLQQSVSAGYRTDLEYMVIAGCLQFCLSNDLDENIVADFYSTIVDYAKAIYLSLPLGHKSAEELSKVYSEYHHNLQAYQALSIAQLEMNLAK